MQNKTFQNCVWLSKPNIIIFLLVLPVFDEVIQAVQIYWLNGKDSGVDKYVSQLGN